MTGHRLLPIGARPLHPTEALIVAAVTDFGNHARQCSCGTIITGRNEVDASCHYKDHLAAVAVHGG